MKKFLTILLFLFIINGMQQSNAQTQKSQPVFGSFLNHPWVDSVLNSMSEDEKIAQLIFVAAYSNRDIAHEVEITDLIRNYRIGGLIFFQGTPEKQAILTNYYQSQSKVPLMIASDGEWGLGMRLGNTLKFPYQMALGAIRNDSLIYEMGREVGREYERLGMQMNLAPVVDINNNPKNPVINYRSFGSDKEKVSRKGVLYMMGMQDVGIIATAKHFPGHGDTDADSHLTLPMIRHSKERIDTMELVPFKQMIQAGVGAVMTAHLNIPALDTTPGLASTLSKPIVTRLLKKELGFQGLVITDALNMKGVTKFYPPGIVDVKALLAGNDVLEFSEDVPRAILEIKKALKAGQISSWEVEARCRKVLAAKYWTGLARLKPVSLEHLSEDLNTSEAMVLNHKLVKASLTVLRNENQSIPVQDLAHTRVASLNLGAGESCPFQEMLKNYTRIESFYWDGNTESAKALLKKLEGFDLVIAGMTGLNQRPYKSFGITPELQEFIGTLVDSTHVIVSLFGNPFALAMLPGIEKAKGLIVTYQDDSLTQEMAAQLIFGGIGADGVLPVNGSEAFPAGSGQVVSSIGRLRYELPEEEGMNSRYMNQKIDSIAKAGIEAGAFPGCEVLAARNGAVVFHKTYGYHTYYNREKVEKRDLFDFASVTKTTGPLPALMHLYDQRDFKLDDRFQTLWPDFKHSNKSDLNIREVLAHQSGMIAWIPYWRNTVRQNDKFRFHTFKTDSSAKYDVPVIEGLYLYRNYRKKMYKAIKKSPVSAEKKYLYSGLSFYLYPQIIENLTHENYQTYLKENFYHPLGAWTLTYNAHDFYPLPQIIPTEVDTFFRKKAIHGWVHDEGAAMMGGVSGNAGLFGTANDLAKLVQMYLNMGSFGGRQYISDTTMKEFTRYQYPENDNRRGLGFDKPLLNNTELSDAEAYPARSASSESFGHSGYTGTFYWADPETGLLYIFFSNRVYPTRENSKIYDLNIRTSIQQALYDSMRK